MPAHVCPSCKKTNPEAAVYCYFDGMLLKGGAPGAGNANQLPAPMVFPSGRNCGSFDELVQGCQEEWTVARDMLSGGTFQQYFGSIGRMDLVKACQEASQQDDPDIGLSQLLGAMPASAAVKGPKLELNPRRLSLGRVMAGETRKLPFKILNIGQGTLQGTLSVAEGEEWLKTGGAGGQVVVKTSREQQIPLMADTRGLTAGEPYAAKLRIITNGGVEEVPIRIDVGSHVFPKAPFQGAKSPRDMAVKMKKNPKAAAALLQSGDLPKWFNRNGWTYPIDGTPAQGVAGVQQFFEAMGLAKAPPVKLSQPEIRLACRVPDKPRFQVNVLTPVKKKLIYATVRTDAPWLNIATPSVTGTQQAGVAFEIDSRALPKAKQAETVVQFVANGNQKLNLKVRVEVQRPADSIAVKMAQPVVLMALAFLLVRLLISPVVDFYARSVAVSDAATKSVKVDSKKLKDGEKVLPVEDDAPARTTVGWLKVPWLGLLLGTQDPPEEFFGKKHAARAVNRVNFRDYFVASFVKTIVMLTWWIGALVGAFLLIRKTSFFDGIWGLLSGAAMGMVGAASLACLLLIVDLIPGIVFGIAFGSADVQLFHMIIWVVLTVICWTAAGAALGVALLFLGPIGKVILGPVQDTFAGFFQLCGLRKLASLCASS